MLCAAFLSTNTLAQTAAPAGAGLDEAAFRAGLRQRGLERWLAQYDADHPATDAVDAALRRRETLLSDAVRATSPAARVDTLEASAILAKLISDHPTDPRRLDWQVELARDVLEREGQGVFDSLLLYDLPGRDRARSLELSRRGVEVLQQLQADLAAEWKRVEALDETAIEQSTARLQALEATGTQSAMLLAWARLYAAFAGRERSRDAAAELLAEVTERQGWTEESAPPVQRCSALMLAAVAARLGGRYDAATECTRQFLVVLKGLPTAEDRDRFRTAGLLAVLEQIRTMRDSGKLDAARDAVNVAREWVAKNRANELQATLAVALASGSLASGAGGVASAPASTPADEPWLTPVVAAALEPIASRSPAWRDGVYAALSGALESEPFGNRSGLEVQLLLGAAVSQVDPLASGSTTLRRDESRSGLVETASTNNQDRSRLEALLLAAKAAAVATGTAESVRGELQFLLGKGYFLLGQSAEAVASLAELCSRFPSHDRAPAAAEAGCAIAQSWWQGTKGESREARGAFIRSAKVLREGWPKSPMARGVAYLLALALEQDGQLEASAEAYAVVESGDSQHLKAVLGRARSLANAALRDLAGQDSTKVRESAAQAVKVAREAVDSAEIRTAADPERCVAAEIVLVLANLLNGPAVRQPADCLEALKGFEERFADCPAAIGPALRERIVALRQLNRLAEARQVVEQFLRADPASAGPVMAGLLQAMRREVDLAFERDDGEAARRVAAEAAELARVLLEWSTSHAGRLSASETATVRTWQAWSVLEAGGAEAALRMFDSLAALGSEVIAPDAALRLEIQLGRAECLLQLGRSADALPLFSEAWQRVPERGQLWWRALAGSLTCHTRLGSNREEILQSIRQQRRLAQHLGGARWKRALETIERESLHSQPAPAGQ